MNIGYRKYRKLGRIIIFFILIMIPVFINMLNDDCFIKIVFTNYIEYYSILTTLFIVLYEHKKKIRLKDREIKIKKITKIIKELDDIFEKLLEQNFFLGNRITSTDSLLDDENNTFSNIKDILKELTNLLNQSIILNPLDEDERMITNNLSFHDAKKRIHIKERKILKKMSRIDSDILRKESISIERIRLLRKDIENLLISIIYLKEYYLILNDYFEYDIIYFKFEQKKYEIQDYIKSTGNKLNMVKKYDYKKNSLYQ